MIFENVSQALSPDDDHTDLSGATMTPLTYEINEKKKIIIHIMNINQNIKDCFFPQEYDHIINKILV